MPKQRRDRSMSFDRLRSSPYSYGSRQSKKLLPKNPLENEENEKEWEEARCPVCLEHPHNAILLLCSSHAKGCHPFMCDTSYRHSNCFDQFRKLSEDASSTTNQIDEASVAIPHLTSSSTISSEAFATEIERPRGVSTSTQSESHEGLAKMKLVCPLCRGEVNGWIVIEAARNFMNSKSRSCACETCKFSGTYADLRKHARRVHPHVRPTDADPERQQNWRRLEQQSELDDLLSTLQSAVREERGMNSSSPLDEGGWLTVFLLVRILRPETSSRSSSRSGSSTQARVTIRRRPRRRLWGETHDWDSDSRGDDTEASDGNSQPWEQHDQVQRGSTPEN